MNKRQKEDPTTQPTHIMIFFRTPDKDQDDLYRADGILVASRQNDMVRFGQDIATAQTRGFLNYDLAQKFIRKLANVDIEAERQGVSLLALVEGYTKYQQNGAVIDERDGDREGGSLIIKPGNHSHVQFGKLRPQ